MNVMLEPGEIAFLALTPSASATVATSQGPFAVRTIHSVPWVAIVPHDRRLPDGLLRAEATYHMGETIRLAAENATRFELRKGRPSRDLWLAVRRELRAGRSVAVHFEDQPYYNKTRPVAVAWRPVEADGSAEARDPRDR